MISKLITYGPTRETAADVMRRALDTYVIQVRLACPVSLFAMHTYT